MSSEQSPLNNHCLFSLPPNLNHSSLLQATDFLILIKIPAYDRFLHPLLEIFINNYAKTCSVLPLLCSEGLKSEEKRQKMNRGKGCPYQK